MAMMFIDTLKSVFFSPQGSPAPPPSPCTPSLNSPPRKRSLPGEDAPQTKQQKPKKELIELTMTDPDHFQGSLAVLPFTLKNMALRYAPDLRWDLVFGGVNWQFYVHVLASEGQRICDNALIGLKVVGDDPALAAPLSSPQLPGDCVVPSPPTAVAAAAPSLPQFSPRSSAMVTSPCPPIQAITQFEVSWRVLASDDDETILAACPPSVHCIEPGDDYVVEYTNEEFRFGKAMNEGISLQVSIRLLPPSALTPLEPLAGPERGGMEEEEEKFYCSKGLASRKAGPIWVAASAQ